MKTKTYHKKTSPVFNGRFYLYSLLPLPLIFLMCMQPLLA